jgi:hypothetical protein
MHKSTKTHSTPSTLSSSSTIPTEYARYLTAAMKLASSDVKPLHGDVSLSTVNAARGVEVILARAAEVTMALPRSSISRPSARSPRSATRARALTFDGVGAKRSTCVVA